MKNFQDTFCITMRLLIKVVAEFPFYFFPILHSRLFLCVFLLLCWDNEHGGKQIKFKIQFFHYYFVVESLCIVTDLVWVETQILFHYNLFEGSFD